MVTSSLKENMATLGEVIPQVVMSLKKECKRLAESGGVSMDRPEAWRIILVTALLNEADSRKLHTHIIRKGIKNLRNF